MSNFYTDNDDLRFYLEKAIDWAPLVSLTELGFRRDDGFKSTEEAIDFYRDVCELVGDFAANQIAPRAKAIDHDPMELVDGEVVFNKDLQAIFDGIKELELHRMCLPRDVGGMNCPLLVYYLTNELLARADVSVMTHHSFHGGIAMALLMWSLEEGSSSWDPEELKLKASRFSEAIEEIGSGEAWGCMDITEPDAGSDMGALRTRAEQDADGNWWITGQKIFITSGHGKYHIVIARTEHDTDPEDPMAGLGGLSLFLVKAYDDLPDGTRRRVVTIDRLEEKIGHHGSATCAITFDKAPAELIGKRGEGFKGMLLLMNNARVGVSCEGVGLAEAAYRMAVAYASERRSMGKTIDKHEMIADYLEEMNNDIQGLRALWVEAAWYEEMSQKLRAFTTLDNSDELQQQRRVRQSKEYGRRARRLTPLLKYLSAEKACEIARRAIQIHGGAGYTTEYGAEKLLRDALVLPIYEGTSQIQSLMATKDTLGQIMKAPQDFLRRSAQARWRSLSSRDPLERRVAKIQSLSLASQQALISRTARDKFKTLLGRPMSGWAHALTQDWDVKRDFAFALLHAERLTRLLADEAIAEILLSQSQRFPERREVLETWLERAEPRARALHDAITSTGSRLIHRLHQREERPPRDSKHQLG